MQLLGLILEPWLALRAALSSGYPCLFVLVYLKGRGHFESLLYNFNILMGKSMKNHVVEEFERKKSFKIRYFINNDKNCVWLKPNYYSNPIFQIHF